MTEPGPVFAELRPPNRWIHVRAEPEFGSDRHPVGRDFPAVLWRRLDTLYESDRETHKLVNQAILVLERNGPAEGRPLVDTIAGSSIPNMKELRPGSVGKSEIRILFAFDPWRSAILLIAGNKAGQRQWWYRETIPRADQLYESYLQERRKELGR